MADEKRKVVRSVPSSPVDSIKLFLSKTPIPTLKRIAKSPEFVKGAPTPVQEGQMTPNTEALSLLTGFATGQVTMKGDEVQHIPSISQSLGTIWETPKHKVTDGSANRTKKAKVAKKEPRRNISKQMAKANPRTKIPDSEIRIENIIQGSPSFVPRKIKVQTPGGREKGAEEAKMNIMNSDSGMARTKKTLTVKQRVARAGRVAKAALPKPCRTPSGGKAPQKQLATKAACKQGSGQGVKPKPCRNYTMIALREIWRFQRSVDLLIPLLPLQRLVCELHRTLGWISDFRVPLS